VATATIDKSPTGQHGPNSSALQSSVLVLNRLYMVTRVVGVRRAIGLLINDHAEVIHNESDIFANYDFGSWRELSAIWAEEKNPPDDWLRSVRFEILVPRVIRLLHYDRLPKLKLNPSRQAIFARDGYRCQYCGRTFPLGQLSLDHVVPQRDGGKSTWENMVCACRKCNVKKGGRTPRDARMKLLTKPIRPRMSPLIVRKMQEPKYQTWITWLDKETIAHIGGDHIAGQDDFDAA
jgi:5-methylcytosine-specific restriction endonuclease McrA